MSHHTIMLACNRPRDGSFVGSFDLAEVCGPGGERLMSFEGPPIKVRFWLRSKCGAPPSFNVWGCRRDGRHGRIWVHSEGYRQWYGNWCWDAFFVDREAVGTFLRILRIAGWGCHEGASDLFDLWGQPGRDVAARITELL